MFQNSCEQRISILLMRLKVFNNSSVDPLCQQDDVHAIIFNQFVNRNSTCFRTLHVENQGRLSKLYGLSS